MSTRDDDILDFDFFDEEDAPRGRSPRAPIRSRLPAPGRGRRGSGFRPPRNLTPLLRLIGLIALAILVVVLLVVWVEGCTADAKLDRNRTYLADIGSIGTRRRSSGSRSARFTTPGLNEEDLDAKLGGYVQTAENQMQQAEDLNAPGPMVVPNAGRSRRCGIAERAPRTAGGVQGVDRRNGRHRGGRAAARPDEAPAGERHHLVDSFQEPAEVVLQDEGIEGLDVPSSEFVTTDDLVSQSSLAAIWQRIQGAPTAVRQPGSTAAASRTSRRCRAGSSSRRRRRRRSRSRTS